MDLFPLGFFQYGIDSDRIQHVASSLSSAQSTTFIIDHNSWWDSIEARERKVGVTMRNAPPHTPLYVLVHWSSSSAKHYVHTAWLPCQGGRKAFKLIWFAQMFVTCFPSSIEQKQCLGKKWKVGMMMCNAPPKEVQIVYRLFLVNCYLLHVSKLSSQPGSSGRGWVIDFFWLRLPWQYIAMTRNNLLTRWLWH